MKYLYFKKLFVLTALVLSLIPPALFSQSIIYTTSGEKTQNHNEFAGGSACCNCNTEHYGQLPSDFPVGKVQSIIFYLTTSRANSYYTQIKNGPTKLTLKLGDRISTAMSEKVQNCTTLPVNVSWIIDFKYDPPTSIGPHMEWRLLDGDDNIYSAVWVHSSDVDLDRGLPGFSNVYGCQYSRVVKATYSVKFNMLSETTTKSDYELVDDSIVVKQNIRKQVLKTAVIEFSERGDLGIQDAGAIIAEWMTTALKKTKAFEIYERLSLEKLMEEHKLGMSGLMDEVTIAQIGKMRGVQAIVTGSVIKFGDIISVTAKLINTETAQVIDSADIKATDVNSISSKIDKLAMELSMD